MVMHIIKQAMLYDSPFWSKSMPFICYLLTLLLKLCEINLILIDNVIEFFYL